MKKHSCLSHRKTVPSKIHFSSKKIIFIDFCVQIKSEKFRKITKEIKVVQNAPNKRKLFITI